MPGVLAVEKSWTKDEHSTVAQGFQCTVCCCHNGRSVRMLAKAFRIRPKQVFWVERMMNSSLLEVPAAGFYGLKLQVEKQNIWMLPIFPKKTETTTIHKPKREGSSLPFSKHFHILSLSANALSLILPTSIVTITALFVKSSKLSIYFSHPPYIWKTGTCILQKEGNWLIISCCFKCNILAEILLL